MILSEPTSGDDDGLYVDRGVVGRCQRSLDFMGSRVSFACCACSNNGRSEGDTTTNLCRVVPLWRPSPTRKRGASLSVPTDCGAAAVQGAPARSTAAAAVSASAQETGLPNAASASAGSAIRSGENEAASTVRGRRARLRESLARFSTYHAALDSANSTHAAACASAADGLGCLHATLPRMVLWTDCARVCSAVCGGGLLDSDAICGVAVPFLNDIIIPIAASNETQVETGQQTNLNLAQRLGCALLNTASEDLLSMLSAQQKCTPAPSSKNTVGKDTSRADLLSTLRSFDLTSLHRVSAPPTPTCEAVEVAPESLTASIQSSVTEQLKELWGLYGSHYISGSLCDFSRKFGINEFACPKAGDALVTFPAILSKQWNRKVPLDHNLYTPNFHYAAVVFVDDASGTYTTLENFSTIHLSRGPDDSNSKWKFFVYRTEDGPHHLTTYHERLTRTGGYGNVAMTLVVRSEFHPSVGPNKKKTKPPKKPKTVDPMKVVDLSFSDICAIPSEVLLMTSLKSLNFKGASFKTIPHELSQLTALTSLNMQANELTSLEGLRTFAANLCEFNACCNELTECDIVVSATNLRTLVLGGNSLSHFPDISRTHTALHTLKLNDNRLTNESFCCMPPSVQFVSLAGNLITEIPPSAIKCLSRITILNLQRNHLRELPSEIFSLTMLRELDLSHNTIAVLGSHVCGLKNLTQLLLENNKLTTLPTTITQLCSLTTLDLSHNLFRVFPTKIIATLALQGLSSVSFHSNDISEFDPLVEANLTESPPQDTLASCGISALRKMTPLDVSLNPIIVVPKYLQDVPQINDSQFSCYAQEFCPNVYIGNIRAASCKSSLKLKGITHILNCAAVMPDYYFPKDFRYKILNAADEDKELQARKLAQSFSSCVEFISEAVRSGGSCLVHCFAGVSRSATIACAYLIAVQNIAPDKALEYLRTVRPIVCPNNSFMKQLWLYYDTQTQRISANSH
ncbi:dual specificity protein phosphatase 1 [Pelomyxa schiedti]|nr:dual specificity protein phosphatase 1 [Pelomyxa schiedti]